MKHILFITSFTFFSCFAQAAITLTIKRADGSIYWIEHFNRQTDGDKWLATEKTRPYWKSEYVATFSGSEDAPADMTALQAKAASQTTRLNSLKSLKDAPTLTPAQQTQILQHLLKKELGE